VKPLRPTYQRKGFCLWLKRLEAERFKTKHNAGDTRADLDLKRQVHAQVFRKPCHRWPQAVPGLVSMWSNGCGGCDEVMWSCRD